MMRLPAAPEAASAARSRGRPGAGQLRVIWASGVLHRVAKFQPAADGAAVVANAVTSDQPLPRIRSARASV
jgi:hypothetical protein